MNDIEIGKYKLTVLIVNFNSCDFVDSAIYCLNKTTKNRFIVKIVDSSPSNREYRNLLKKTLKYDDVFVERKELSLRGSVQHGTLLNYMVEDIKTPYFVILDADAAFLKKGWDEILIGKMNKKTPLFGTQAPPNKNQKYPLMFAIIFRTKEFQELGIDFRPKDISKGLDTGCEIAQKYFKGGFDGGILKERRTKIWEKGPFKDVDCAEYYLDGMESVFASHFWRGSSLGQMKYRKGANIFIKFFFRIPLVGIGYLRIRGLLEKKKWIKICKKVVDAQ